MNSCLYGKTESLEESFPGHKTTLRKECSSALIKHFYPAWFTLFDENNYYDHNLVGFISFACMGADMPCPFGKFFMKIPKSENQIKIMNSQTLSLRLVLC